MEGNKTLVEYKKFMPPPALWIVLIMVIGWAIKTYVPIEYVDTANMAWGVLLLIASGWGVSKAKLYEVAGTAGVDLPDMPIAAATYSTGPSGAGQQSIVARPAADQHKVSRWLL